MENKETMFHKSRVAFMIINSEILFLENSGMSHIEWYTSLNYPIENFDNIVRGYYKEGKIIFYKGDFIYDEDVINQANKFANKIKEYVKDNDAKVYAGIIKGEIGEMWPPAIEIENL